jgi:hypothetical protein
MTHAATPKRRTRGATHEDNTHEEADSNNQPPPPDGGWGWVVVFASFAIHIIGKFWLHYAICSVIDSVCLGFLMALSIVENILCQTLEKLIGNYVERSGRGLS